MEFVNKYLQFNVLKIFASKVKKLDLRIDFDVKFF